MSKLKNMSAMTKTLLFLTLLLVWGCTSNNQNRLRNTIFKMGLKTALSSTGPRNNSAFVLKVNDTLPPILLTAHHTVARIGANEFLPWNKIGDHQKDAWAWSMHDSTVNFKVGKNIPIKNAQTLKLDIAAFYVPNDIPYLKPAKNIAQVGDTIYLFSKIIYQNKTSILNRGVVIYTTDSVMVYELTDFYMARFISTGTSGSCVINKDGDVVSNSYAKFTIPNDQVRKELALEFPLINRLETKEGKTYGVGVPITLIEKSLLQAF